MAQAMAVPPEPAHAGELDHLPALLGRLGDQVTRLVDSKIGLLKVEVREEVSAYIQKGAVLVLGGVIALVGFALVNVAAALGVSLLFANMGISIPASYAIGFVATGLFYLIIGGIIVMTMKNRIANQTIVPPKTAAELKKDKQWLTNEL